MSDKLVIRGKEYTLNKDRTPALDVAVSGESVFFDVALKPIQQYYTISYSVNPSSTDILLVFCSIKKLMASQLVEISNANYRKIPHHIIHTCLGQSDLTSLQILFPKAKIHKVPEEEAAKKVRSLIAKRSYGLKLEGEDWDKLREKALEEAEFRCRLCNKHKDETALRVHHRTYDRQGTEDEYKDLTVLCVDCHGNYHKTTD